MSAVLYSYVTSLITMTWNSGSLGAVQKGVRQPTVPNLNPNCSADKNDDNETIEFGMYKPQIKNITQVKFWVYAQGSQNLTLNVKIAGTPQTGISTNVASTAWYSATFAGTWTGLNFQTGFSILMTVPSMGRSDAVHVYAAYCEVTGDRVLPIIS